MDFFFAAFVLFFFGFAWLVTLHCDCDFAIACTKQQASEPVQPACVGSRTTQVEIVFVRRYHLIRDVPSATELAKGKQGFSDHRRSLQEGTVESSEVIAQGQIEAFSTACIEGGVAPIAVGSNGTVHVARDIDELSASTSTSDQSTTASPRGGGGMPSMKWRLQLMLAPGELLKAQQAGFAASVSVDVATIFLGDAAEQRWVNPEHRTLELGRPSLALADAFAARIEGRFYPVLRQSFLHTTTKRAGTSSSSSSSSTGDHTSVGFGGRIPAIVVSTNWTVFDVSMLPGLRLEAIDDDDIGGRGAKAAVRSDKRQGTSPAAGQLDVNSPGRPPLSSRIFLYVYSLAILHPLLIPYRRRPLP